MKFDCKVATVTVQSGATLARDAADKALRDAGFGMGEFAGGPPPSFGVVRAVLRRSAGTDPLPPGLASELSRELRNVRELVIERDGEHDGRLTILLESEGKIDETTLSAALVRHGLVASGYALMSWPKSAAAYVATLAGPTDDAARGRARTAFEAAEGVLAAFIEPAGDDLVVWMREPCTNAETRLRDALGGTRLKLERVTARPPAAVAPKDG